MLIAILLVAPAVVMLLAHLILRRQDAIRYGITPEVREAARSAEPDPGADEPEEFA